MVKDSIRFYVTILDDLASLGSAGKLREFSKTIPLEKRKKLITFISDETNVVNSRFTEAFSRFLNSIQNKITPKIFEIILKIGVNFMKNDDIFWFHLINILDYGATFDQVELLDFLIDQILKEDGNSWKATCLICILVQDYPALRTRCVKSLSKVHEEIYTVLSRVKDFATSSYLVELISQLENEALISLIFCQDPELCDKFPDNCYANDAPCLKFLQLTKFDPSIYSFNSFSLGSALKVGKSHCQLTPKYLITLVEYNDFAAPIQFDLSTIRNMQRVGNEAHFNLAETAKKALINVEVAKSACFALNFDSEKVCKNFMAQYNEYAGKIGPSTPRKISVVQDFIALSAELGEMEYEEDAGDISSQNYANMDPPSNRKDEVSNSGLIEETESLFGSPINTTKDTSVCKKAGRAISVIVAESVEKGSKTGKLQYISTPSHNLGADIFNNNSFEQVPDSLDQAFETFHNPPVERGPFDIAIERTQNEENQSKKDLQESDIWDFESDPDLTLNNPQATSTVNKKYRSKAMKCLTTQMNLVDKKRFNKKAAEETKKSEVVKSKVNVKLEKFDNGGVDHTIKGSPSSLVSMDQPGGSFLPLTSPMVTAHERARTKAFSKAMVNSEIVDPPAEPTKTNEKVGSNVVGEVKAKPPKKPSRGARKRAKDEEDEEDDVEYVEEKPATKKSRAVKAKPVYQEPSDKPTTRITRGKRKQVETTDATKDDVKEMTTAPSSKVKSVPAKAQVREAPKKIQNKPLKTPVPDKAKGDQKLAEIFKDNTTPAVTKKADAQKNVSKTVTTSENQVVQEGTILNESKDKSNETLQTAVLDEPHLSPQTILERNFPVMSSTFTVPLATDSILSEAYTNTLQRQIFESITAFSNQLVKKIHIINDEINKKVMTDLTSKYESLFNDLRDSFQSDVDEMCGFITDVKGLLNLPEQQLIDYIKQKKFGTITTNPIKN